MNLKPFLSAIALPLLWILSIAIFAALPFAPLGNYKWFIMGIICCGTAWGITYLFLKFDRLSIGEIGLKWQSDTLKKFFVGYSLGTAIAVVMFAGVILFTDLQLNRNATSFNPWALFWLLLFLPLSFMEELAFRGYGFIKLNKLIGPRLTIIVTSIIFAYYHDVTGNTFLNQLLGPGIWGIIYGLAAIWSDGIALPTGLHAAANVVQALLGMKEDKYQAAIWEINYSLEVTDAMQVHTDIIGISIQLLLLAIGVFLTEWYLRMRTKHTANIYYR